MTRALTCLEVLEALTVDILEVFDRVCHGGLLQKLKSFGICGQFFTLSPFSSFLSNKQGQLVLDGKSHECFVNAASLLILYTHYTLIIF